MAIKKGITEEQLIEALNASGGSPTKAAEILGCHYANVIRRKKDLILRGLWSVSDSYPVVPDPYYVKGKSILYDQQGNARLTWVKSNVHLDDIKEQILEVVEAFKDDIVQVQPSTTIPDITNSDLLNLFILTDFHLGMKAWHEETAGEDWDLSIAEDFFQRWVNHAVKQMPDAETVILAQMGDFLHWDGMEAVTPRSKHILDVDTRFPKLIRVAVRVLRYAVSALLTKHKKVIVYHVPGNHDESSAPWLRELTSVAYELESRVDVDKTVGLYTSYEHGLTSLYFHHGHKRTGRDLEKTLVAQFRDLFGRTKYSYAHVGHRHSQGLYEGLMIVEQHRTMTPPDAYAAQGGWRSGRDAKIITYHKQFGEVGRITITPEIIKRK